MIIERLHLTNFGIYGGHHVFELAPSLDGDKPIILIEGHNGAGKTTFLESIRLALYGKAALGSRVSRKEYDAHLRDRLHRGGGGREMEIVLEISRNEDGVERRYAITRRWTFGRQELDEVLTITEAGAAIAASSRDELQDFLDDLVPPGVSQLFFFDGEKIQEMAHGDASAGLQQAIGPLLGLDLVEQLRTDLALFVARQKGTDGARALEDAARELAELDAALSAAEERRAMLASERDQATARVRRAETAFRKEGGLGARNEGDARQAKREVEDERTALLGELRDLAGGVGPFRLALKTVLRLEQAAGAFDIEKARRAARRMLAAFEEQVDAQDRPAGPAWERFRAFLTPDERALPVWASGNIAHLQSRIADIKAFAGQRADALGEALDRNQAHSQAADAQLETFHKGLGQDAFDAIRTAEFERGRAGAALEEQDVAVARLRGQRDHARVRLARLQDEQFETARLDRSANLAGKARAALVAYEQRVLANRIEALEWQVLACLHQLLRRPGLVGRVTFDPDTFVVTLRDQADAPVAIESLSAGERQLFAVALLWALARTSERALPLVIDTPLGRLDRLHRQRIIDQYLAGAGAQVVLLCTDTELTEEVAAQLAPFVSRRLSLGVRGNDQRTRIAAWSEDSAEAPAYAAV